MLPFFTRLLLLAAVAAGLAGCSAESKRSRALERAGDYYRAGDWARAQLEYQTVLQKFPDDPTANERLALIWYDRGATLRALAYLSKMYTLAPDNLGLRLKRAQLAASLGLIPDARREALAILGQSTGPAEALVLLTECVRDGEDFRAAEQVLQKHGDKNTAPFQIASANLLMLRGDAAKAKAALTRAIALDPKSAVAHTALAAWLAAQNQPDAARAEHTTAAGLASLRSAVRLKQATYLVQSGLIREAVAALTELTRQVPDYLPAWRALAQIALLEQRHDDALALIQTILTRDAVDYETLILRARVWLARGETKKSIAEFEKIGRDHKGLGVEKYHLALAYLQDQDPASAATPANPIVLANQRVGGTASQTLSLTNTAANDGFSERLNASIGGATGSAVTNGGSFTTLAAAATNGSALSVGVNTATAGAKSGSATITLASDGAGTSGFSALGSISFGNVLVGSSQTRYVTVANSALTDGFSEGLNAALGSFSGPSAGLLASTGGSISNLAAGASNTTTLGVTLNTSASGAVTANVQVLLGSNGATTSGLGVFALPTQNVAIAGQIDALVGNLAAASAATPNPVNFGNVRVGAVVPSQTLSLTNVQAGPAEGLNASLSTGTAGLTATGSFNGLAPGATNSSSLAIGMNTATAGSRNGTATIALTSDGTFNGGVTTALPAQTVNVTGGVYRLANGSVAPGAVVLNAREGGVASAALTVSNTAAADGYSEGLRATAGSATGAAGVAGSSSLVAAGASGGGLAVSLNTASAGAKSGTATINYQSDGLGTSGLAAIAAGSSTVNVSGSVYRVAAANTLPSTINLGTVRAGTVIDTPLSISNVAVGVAGYTETLGATLGTASAGLIGLGSVNGLAYTAGPSNALGIRYTAGAPGAFNGTAAVNFASQEINGSGLGNLSLGSQTIGINATVNALAQFGLTNGGGYTLTSGGAYAATLDFGSLGSPSSISTILNALNLAVGPADALFGSFNVAGLTGTPFSLLGSSFNLGAGGASPFQLSFAPISAGLYTGTVVIGLASHNAFQSDLALNSFTPCGAS